VSKVIAYVQHDAAHKQIFLLNLRLEFLFKVS